MGASRILSAKKHSGKLRKYSALLYASSAHAIFLLQSFRDSIRWYKAGFLSMLEPVGCGWLFFIGCSSMFRLFMRKRRKFTPYAEMKKQITVISLLALWYWLSVWWNPRGCRWMFFIGCSVIYFDSLCVKGDEGLFLFLFTEKNKSRLKIICYTSVVLCQ